ncbi:MEMO1 family protein [Candidatus Woesearchaeota archaeon]|nr:MEMO1 family protein [Candidatus Woesearchaeota archaeon]
MRLPVVAGQFYEGEQKRLEKQIEHSFLSEFGPGELPSKKN